MDKTGFAFQILITSFFNWTPVYCEQASFLGVDILMNPERIPPMVKDYYWDKQASSILASYWLTSFARFSTSSNEVSDEYMWSQ